MYSETNYQLLCQLLERVTGTTAEKWMTQNVIERIGLWDTELPAGPQVSEARSQMYEAWFGMLEPPRDFSVYDMSWVAPAASRCRPLQISTASTVCSVPARSSTGRRLRVGPDLIPDFLALVGDAADGYPGIAGIAGIGAVGAAQLLNRHGSIEVSVGPRPS
jgi:CubicO group peptidase (beta-lactamase class C family)